MSINHRFPAPVPESFRRPQPLLFDPVTGNPPKCQVLEGRDSNTRERETLFEKSLTPSDVGKLNRLVIPKLHAERCFPLGGMGLTGPDSGTLLSFEDESGKCWRFRYSFWSSSQSYVLTKGWSRYVKDKMLEAGDVVFFERHRVNCDRLFIGWRRRGTAAPELPNLSSGGWNGWPVGVAYASSNPDQSGAGLGNPSRRFRLFGVNLECYQQPDHDEGSQHYDYSGNYMDFCQPD